MLKIAANSWVLPLQTHVAMTIFILRDRLFHQIK